tara:strand:+ start:36675 stop:37319 length:645 start_codon:yes stop_codon:yes gene_type:complete
MKQLDIYLDLGNVTGFAALPGTLKLLEATAVSVRWLPISSIIPRPLSRPPRPNTDKNDPAGDPLFEYKQKRYLAKRQFELDELNRDCQRLGLDPSLAARNVDASLTHIACMALLQRQRSALPFMQAVYESRLIKGESLTDQESVSALVKKFDVEDFLEGFERYQGLWVRHIEHYLELGIHDTPCYVLEAETFQGRQHLPLIQWRLEGEVGPPPL